jgi:eukaryotic-like serine/threonine-protein kinase
MHHAKNPEIARQRRQRADVLRSQRRELGDSRERTANPPCEPSGRRDFVCHTPSGMTPGTLIAERFEVGELSSSGGMGHVYRALDRLTGETVALKTLQRQGAMDVSRFLREGRALADLCHPSIVRYIAHGEAAEGEPYVAMEWLEGIDFEDYLSQRKLGVAESLAVARRAAEGLAFAHGRGFLHRDVKPSNLFLVDGDPTRVKILDFGVVRQSGASMSLTATGAMLGTPGYMAPEQVRGRKDIDARADVFSLGCILYRSLTGQAPFESSDIAAVLTRVLFEDVRPPRLLVDDIPDSVDELVCRLLSKEPSDRPTDAGALLLELDGLLVPHSRASPSRLRYEPSAITNKELRVLSIVLTGPSRSLQSQHDATLTEDEASSLVARLRMNIEGLGGRLERLANASFVVMCEGQGTARDQAVRAARCALALRAHLPDAPIAIATGRSEASLALPVGEVIERAARLVRGSADDLDESEPTLSEELGTSAVDWEAEKRAALVRIDDVTASLLGTRFDITGEAEALTLVGERETGEIDPTVLGVATPFVGRERELALLMGSFEQCAGESVANCVLVKGPAGVGKSRLLHEFVRKVRRGGAVEVWTGRGDPIRLGAPFAILAEALATAMGIVPGDSLSDRQRKVEERVLRHVPAEDASRVTDFLGELTGVPFPDAHDVQLRAARSDPMLMGDQMRRAWEDFLTAECRVHPVVLVLEDLHWGDLPTIRFVDAALRQLSDLPLMVVTAARPEIEELYPRLWADRRVQPLPLGELGAKASEKLVVGVLGPNAAPEAVAAIVERAGGNAFYIEELIRSVGKGRGGSLPESVLAMTAARLDSLDPEARRVLRAASVFGQSFWLSGIRALFGGEDRSTGVTEWVQALIEHEYVIDKRESRFAAERELGFRHALLREAAYAMLTEQDRAAGHKLAGRWLLAHGESEPLVLANHFERGGDGPSAIGWYRKSAEQVLEGNDFAAVIARVARAIACGAVGEELGSLRTLEVEGHLWRGEHDEVSRVGKEALANLAHGSVAFARTTARLVISRGQRGRVEEVVELTAGIVQALDTGIVVEGAKGAFAFALARAAGQLLLLGRYEHVEPLALRVRRLASEASDTSDPSLLGWADDAGSSLAMLHGDMGASVTLLASAAGHFVEAGDLRQACVEESNIGHFYLELGVFDEAERFLRECRARADRLGLRQIVAVTSQNLALACAMQGKTDEAKELLGNAIAMHAAHSETRLECNGHQYLAITLVLAGDVEGALQSVQRALAMSESGGPVRASALALHASMLLLRGQASEALALAEAARSIVEELGAQGTQDALVRRAYAEALDRTGQGVRAREVILVACNELLRRAAKISDPTWRRSFLESVKEHARTFDLARVWGVSYAEP